MRESGGDGELTLCGISGLLAVNKVIAQRSEAEEFIRDAFLLS